MRKPVVLDHRRRRRNRPRARHAASPHPGRRSSRSTSARSTPSLAPLVAREFTGSITDASLLDRILAEFEVDRVFHLAALLSTRSEFTPVTAHHVNVEGTLNLLEFAQQQGESHGRPVVFIYPSSIAAYGLPDLETKARAGRGHARTTSRIRRRCTGATSCIASSSAATTRGTTSSCRPTRMPRVDFRCVRFPGLISAMTMPSGGTSDYAPEMIHAAAKGEPYACFVRPDTTIPFMAMPDGVDALLTLAAAPRERLTRTAYNVDGVQPVGRPRSATSVVAAFPRRAITYKIDAKRQGIVDSWPADVDDSAARADWGFAPVRFRARVHEYLIPTIAAISLRTCGSSARRSEVVCTIDGE